MTRCSKHVRGKPFPPKACTLVRLGVLAGLNKVQTVLKGAGGATAVSQVLAKSDAEQGGCWVLWSSPVWTTQWGTCWNQTVPRLALGVMGAASQDVALKNAPERRASSSIFKGSRFWRIACKRSHYRSFYLNLFSYTRGHMDFEIWHRPSSPPQKLHTV